MQTSDQTSQTTVTDSLVPDIPHVPELTHFEGSWIATKPGWHPVELFTRQGAEKAAATGWKVEGVMTYLARLNHEIRDGKAGINKP